MTNESTTDFPIQKSSVAIVKLRFLTALLSHYDLNKCEFAQNFQIVAWVRLYPKFKKMRSFNSLARDFDSFRRKIYTFFRLDSSHKPVYPKSLSSRYSFERKFCPLTLGKHFY